MENEIEKLKAENALLKRQLFEATSRNIFGARLKFKREELGLTQDQIAAKINRNCVAFQSYESGRSEPNIHIMVKLADILGVSLDWLTGRVDDEDFNAPFKTE